MDNYMPVKLFTGDRVLEKHKEEFQLGEKCLIVTGKSSAVKSGALDDITRILKDSNIEYFVYDKIVANPTIGSCLEAGNLAYENKVDFIVGVGGGSALDASKVIAVIANNPGISKEEVYATKWERPGLPLILVGTTAGTGSEVTKVAIITDEETNRKKSTHHNDFYAKIAFGDPRYTLSLNREYTISTGIDALAHCVESYFSNKADGISRAYSISGIKMIVTPLKRLLNEDDEISYTSREELYYGSIFGGLAINMTGTTFAHNLGYYITEQYKKPHGVACAIFMNALFDYEEKENPEYTKEFFDKIGYTKGEIKELVTKLLPDVEIKMTSEEIDSIMPRYENNNSVKNTKGKMSVEDVRQVLEKKFLY